MPICVKTNVKTVFKQDFLDLGQFGSFLGWSTCPIIDFFLPKIEFLKWSYCIQDYVKKVTTCVKTNVKTIFKQDILDFGQFWYFEKLIFQKFQLYSKFFKMAKTDPNPKNLAQKGS